MKTIVLNAPWHCSPQPWSGYPWEYFFLQNIVSVFYVQENQHLIVAKLDDLDDTKIYKTYTLET